MRPGRVCMCVCSCFMGWNRLESSRIVVVYINIYLCMRSSRQLIASPESHLLSSIYTPFPSPNPLPHPFLPLTPIAAALTAAGAWQRRCCAVAITVLSPPVRRQGDRGNCQWYMTEQYMHIYILYICIYCIYDNNAADAAGLGVGCGSYGSSSPYACEWPKAMRKWESKRSSITISISI